MAGDATGITGGIRNNSNDTARVLLCEKQQTRASFQPISFRAIRAHIHDMNQHEAVVQQAADKAVENARAQRFANSGRCRRAVQTDL